MTMETSILYNLYTAPPRSQAALPGPFTAGAFRLLGAPRAGGRRHQRTAHGATGDRGPGGWQGFHLEQNRET